MKTMWLFWDCCSGMKALFQTRKEAFSFKNKWVEYMLDEFDTEWGDDPDDWSIMEVPIAPTCEQFSEFGY